MNRRDPQDDSACLSTLQHPSCDFCRTIITITSSSEGLLISRGLAGRFSGTVSRAACAGQSQGERWRSWETRRQRWRQRASGGGERWRRPLLRERGSALSLSLFGTRSKTRDTTVARYISKVKDLLFSLLSLSRSTFAIIPLSIDLSLPRVRRSRARSGA